jgi:hypothetical protein
VSGGAGALSAAARGVRPSSARAGADTETVMAQRMREMASDLATALDTGSAQSNAGAPPLALAYRSAVERREATDAIRGAAGGPASNAASLRLPM